MRILQVNSNLRVYDHYAFVTDMGKIRVFDLNTGVNIQTIEEDPPLYYCTRDIFIILTLLFSRT